MPCPPPTAEREKFFTFALALLIATRYHLHQRNKSKHAMPEKSLPAPQTIRTQDHLSSRQPVEPGQRTLPSGVIPTDFLFQGGQEVLICHNGENYRLRITRNGKLILTK
jgi:hemin uptake protein HemP